MGPAQNYVTVTRRQPDVEDYIDMLRRYRSWVIGPTFAGLVIAVVVAFCWPDTYESRAVMRITPQAVPATLVEGVGMTSMSQRLEQMEVQILGRTTLMGIIQEPALDLYKKERNHVTLDEVAEKMRTKDIKVKLYDSPGGGQGARSAQAFVIAFRYNDRYKAQQVVRDITGKFQEYNFDLQKTQASTTANFLTDELKTSADRMQAAQDKITQFAAQHAGELPQDGVNNTGQVNVKEQELRSLEETIARTQEEKSQYEIQLQNLNYLETAAANAVEQSVTTAGTTGRDERILNLDKTINDSTQKLKNMQQIYNDDWPDVVTMKSMIKSLEDQRTKLEKENVAAATTTGPTTRTVQNPAAMARVQELELSKKTVQGKIVNLNQELERRQKRYNQVQAELLSLQAKVASSPAIVQQYNALQSELTLAKENYDAQSKMRDKSETAQRLEDHHAGEMLDLLDAADLPEAPVEPNRWAIVGLGTFVGLLAGFGLAGAKELKNTSLKNLKDVRAYTNLPVLSSVPLLENALLVRRKRRLAWLAWSSAVVIGGVLMSGAAYYYISGKAGPS
jgi:polysaccharide biosynthesis transport protein